MVGSKQVGKDKNTTKVNYAEQPHQNTAYTQSAAAFGLNKNNYGNNQKQGHKNHHTLAQKHRKETIKKQPGNTENRDHEATSFLR